jgi:caa(3)-type oxidase subunit IV
MREERPTHHPDYVKVWGILVLLLVVSVVGSWAGIRWLTLAMAFGVAVSKAYLVAKHFMHVHVEKRWIPYLLIVCVAFMIVLFAGVAPDVMKHRGLHWINYSAEQAGQSAPSGTTHDQP